jgi:polysaccharide biosynthesis protein PslG
MRKLAGLFKRIGVVTFLVFIYPGGSVVHAAPGPQFDLYEVQPGDTGTSIAAQYGITAEALWRANGVINPSQISEGQQLFIPDDAGGHLETSLSTYQVSGEQSIIQAAFQSSNLLSSLLILNGLPSPAQGLGQQIYTADMQAMPAVAEQPTPVPTQSQPDAPTPVPGQVEDVPSGAILEAKAGIQLHYSVPNNQLQDLLDMTAYDLEFRWVKVQVDWALTEYMQGHYSVELDKLDQFMDSAYNRNRKILLSVVKAPDWARSTTDLDGPPTDYNTYYNFLRFLIQRYRFKLAAIEVWNEPNLGREWTGGTLSGSEYVNLLRGAYETVKKEDARIVVISAGLAPTGISDGVNSMDDRDYLRQMYDAGVADYADAIGIHPYGWANPPEIRCCNSPDGPPTHNNDPSFFFLNTIEDYRAIQEEYGDSDRQLWATEFGWGTMEGLDLPVPEEQPFIGYLGAVQQAEYDRDAFLIGQQWDFMGPMFLWNLNVATLDGYDPNQGAYSILAQIDRPRLAYDVLRDTPRIND